VRIRDYLSKPKGDPRPKKVREVMIYTVNTRLSVVQLVFVRYSSVDCSVVSSTDIRPKTCTVDEDVRSE
jgi:hypothetical protein